MPKARPSAVHSTSWTPSDPSRNSHSSDAGNLAGTSSGAGNSAAMAVTAARYPAAASIPPYQAPTRSASTQPATTAMTANASDSAASPK